MKQTLNEFKAFLLRGNAIDMAVAVVVGAAFSGIVNALVKDMLTPLITAVGGQPNFSALYFEMNTSRFMIGDFLNAVISFLLIGTVVFFLVVKPITWLTSHRKKDPGTKPCPFCLNDIPRAATRCGHCTATLPQG